MTVQEHTAQINLSELLRPYEDKWVALSPDYTRVVASGDTRKEVDASVKKEERETLIFHKVLPFDALFAPRLAA